MKIHWLSEIKHARTARRRHQISGSWYTYTKRQANRQVRRNAQLDIDEGLDEVIFADDDRCAYTNWERNNQRQLMFNNEHILIQALEFCCKETYSEYDWERNRDWRLDGEVIAYEEYDCIRIANHTRVWNAFKLFL